MAKNDDWPRPGSEDILRLAVEAKCSPQTVRNWYGRRSMTRGQRHLLEQAARALGVWEPAPPAPEGEANELAREAAQRGLGTSGWVPGAVTL